MKIAKTITIDLARAPGYPTVLAVEGDSGTRSIDIRLKANMEPWLVPQGVTASLVYQKPDGTAGWYDTLPNGEPAYTIRENAVSIALAPQVLTAAGSVNAAVVLRDDAGNQLTTFGFIIHVLSSPADEQTSKDYYNLKIAATLEELAARLDELEQKGGAGIPGADGKSAYELAQDAGFEGTVEEWLDFLKGADGAPGGDGQDGAPGKSAYEYAREAGYKGTEAEFAQKLAEDAPKAFYITVSGDAENGYTVDKTSAEIQAAYEAGCSLYAVYPDGDQMRLPLANADVDSWWLSFVATFYPYTYVLVLNTSGDEITVEQAEAMEVTAEMVGALPADFVSGASVGQTVRITAVDEKGVPTAWEAADMAGAEPGDFRLITQFQTEEGVEEYDITTDDAGEPFALDEMVLMIDAQDTAGFGYHSLKINGVSVLYYAHSFKEKTEMGLFSKKGNRIFYLGVLSSDGVNGDYSHLGVNNRVHQYHGITGICEGRMNHIWLSRITSQSGSFTITILGR